MAQGGSHLMISGFVRPHEFESAPERAYFSAIHYLVLTCAPDEFTRRVRRRQAWGHLPDSDFDGLHALNEWFRTDVADHPAVTVLDTTGLAVEDAADLAVSWARRSVDAS